MRFVYSICVEVWDYGYSYLALKACRDMGLHGCLAGAFGEQCAIAENDAENVNLARLLCISTVM